MSKPSTSKQEILEDFKLKKDLLKKYSAKVEGLIGELLIDKSIPTHQISVRVKEYDSLAKKLDKKAGKYLTLNEVTDIVGIRIIVYLENEVDFVAAVIDKEFIIDKENSIDKRKSKVDSFGYKSLHYVVSLNEQRCKLTEYKRFKDLKAEIQIRSVLQHAWAEIEHDLGYKGANEIPEQHKRTFHRIAAQLETADLEFVRLKKDLDDYEQILPKDIVAKPEEVLIDKASLKSYLDKSVLVADIDQKIATAIGGQTHSNFDISEFILTKYGYFKVNTIKDLNDLLKEHADNIVAFAKFFIKSSVDVPQGISVYYLFYTLLLNKPDRDFIEGYLKFGGTTISVTLEELVVELENFKNGKKRGDK